MADLHKIAENSRKAKRTKRTKLTKLIFLKVFKTMVEIKAFLFGVTRAIKEAPELFLRGV